MFSSELTLDKILYVRVSALICLIVMTLNVALCVVDTGNYFKKRCLHQTLEFKAEASVMCMFVFFFL